MTLELAAEVVVGSQNGVFALQKLGFPRLQADCYLVDPQQVQCASSPNALVGLVK